MSFGIAYALAVFQPLVSDALRFSSHFCVCLFSKTSGWVGSVWNEKSEFCMPTVSFLEYTLQSEWRKTSPECSNGPLLLATKNYKNFWGFYKAKSHPFWLIWLLSQGLGMEFSWTAEFQKVHVTAQHQFWSQPFCSNSFWLSLTLITPGWLSTFTMPWNTRYTTSLYLPFPFS